MVTMHREAGLSIAIFNDDHDPAHVHVRGDGEARVNLIGPDGQPALVWSVGLSESDLRFALRIVVDRQSEFLARWRGTPHVCPGFSV